MLLGSNVGGRWSTGAGQLLWDLVRVRAQLASPAVRDRRCVGISHRQMSDCVRSNASSEHCPLYPTMPSLCPPRSNTAPTTCSARL